LIYLPSLSQLTGCEIFGKAEFLNPGGSVKDRAAKAMITEAELSGALKPGTTIYEGTAGNTGIGLAMIAAQRGYSCKIVMPDNQASEKYETLRALGAEIIAVKPCPFSDRKHFYHQAKALAEAEPGSFWANQFENLANYRAHFETTGPEIYLQTQKAIDVFIAATGTGGTIAGVSCFLKSVKPQVQVILADPMGSGMKSYLETQEINSSGNSVTEGIGIMRLTENFKKAQIDQAVSIGDQQMISMLYHLAKKEGLLVGTSAALNVFAAFQYAMKHKNSKKIIVTVLCDSALRYQSRVFNFQWLAEKKLEPVDLQSLV